VLPLGRIVFSEILTLSKEQFLLGLTNLDFVLHH